MLLLVRDHPQRQRDVTVRADNASSSALRSSSWFRQGSWVGEARITAELFPP